MKTRLYSKDFNPEKEYNVCGWGKAIKNFNKAIAESYKVKEKKPYDITLTPCQDMRKILEEKREKILSDNKEIILKFETDFNRLVAEKANDNENEIEMFLTGLKQVVADYIITKIAMAGYSCSADMLGNGKCRLHIKIK